VPLIQYLKQLRERAAKLGATAVKNKTGLDYNTVNNFVTGKNTTEKTMVAVDAAVTELEKLQ